MLRPRINPRPAWRHTCFFSATLRFKAACVKTEVKCLQITEVRCPLFTGYRVQSSRMKRLWECGHLVLPKNEIVGLTAGHVSRC